MASTLQEGRVPEPAIWAGEPPDDQGTQSPEAPAVRASFVRRLAAFAIDSSLVFGVVTSLLAAGHASYETARLVGSLSPVLIFPLYFAVAEAVFGRTVGKHWFGIEVRRSNGSRPGTARLVGREMLRGAFWAFLVIPFAVDRQLSSHGWHESSPIGEGDGLLYMTRDGLVAVLLPVGAGHYSLYITPAGNLG